MTDQRIRELLAAMAEPVPPPQPPEDLWRRAMRRRWRRRMTGAGMTVTLAAALAVGVAGLPEQPPTPGALASPGSSPGSSPVSSPDVVYAIDTAPTAENEGNLPVMVGERVYLFPRDGSWAVPLSKSPVARALALFQFPGDQEIYLLGDDRELRYIDKFDKKVALYPAALSPDGRQAALTRNDEVTLADLTTGAAPRSIKVPGRHQAVAWVSNGTALAVSQQHESYLITQTLAGKRLPYGGGWVTEQYPADNPDMLHLRLTGDGTVLTRFASGRTAVEQELVPFSDVVARLDGEAWRAGGLIASAGQAFIPDSGSRYRGIAESRVVALDEQTGRIVRVLVFVDPGSVHCCKVVGWFDRHQVLIHNAETSRLLAWNVRTGSLRRYADDLSTSAISFSAFQMP